MASRRAVLAAGVAGVLLAAAPPAAAEYLEDARTARAVMLQAPRAPLRECLRALSHASGVSLTAAPALAGLSLVGYVPSRPLRETMDALAELFDASWTALPGNPRGYRLDPVAAKHRAQAAAREAVHQRYRKGIDELSAEAVRAAKPGEPGPGTQQWQTLALLLWSHLKPAERDRVLRGESVTIPVPEARAKREYELVLSLSRRDSQKLTGPLLATYDLDDRSDTAFPSIRTRATALREDSIIGAIGLIELNRFHPAPKLPPAEDDRNNGSPVLPPEIGDNGRFVGTRDYLVLQLGEKAGVPILSRHRARGGAASSLDAGGRKLSQVLGRLAYACGADHRTTSRGFQLLRSKTESSDQVGEPPAEVVRAYLKEQPPAGKPVRFATAARLAELVPLRLSVLRNSNVATSAAGFASQGYALLRFYRQLNPAQREALFSDAGLEVASLAHAPLHALLDERAKRAEFDVYNQLQQLKGLRLRFRERLAVDPPAVILEAVRGDEVVSTTELELPVAGKEPAPTAKR